MASKALKVAKTNSIGNHFFDGEYHDE